MSRQTFNELLYEPPVVNQTTVAAAADTVLWDAATNTPLAANQVRTGQLFKVSAWGVMSTPATGQTVTINPRFGTAVGGTLLGASPAAPTVAAALTNTPWFLEMWAHFRTVGAAGLVTCCGLMTSQAFVGVAAGTGRGESVNFGTASATATTVNTTVAAGLVVSVAANIATVTFTCMGVAMEARN